jgi:hypothetical protein
MSIRLSTPQIATVAGNALGSRGLDQSPPSAPRKSIQCAKQIVGIRS